MMAFERKIDAGQVLLAVAMFGSVCAYIVSGHESVTNLTTKIQETKSDLSNQIQGLSNAIANLPADREKTNELYLKAGALERRIDGVDGKLSDLSTRVTRVEATTAVPTPFRQSRPPP